MENYEVKRFLKEQIILAIMLVIVYFVMFYAFPASCRYFASLFNRIYDISFETSSFHSLQEALQLFFGFVYKTLIYFALFVFFAIEEFFIFRAFISKDYNFEKNAQRRKEFSKFILRQTVNKDRR